MISSLAFLSALRDAFVTQLHLGLSTLIFEFRDLTRLQVYFQCHSQQSVGNLSVGSLVCVIIVQAIKVYDHPHFGVTGTIFFHPRKLESMRHEATTADAYYTETCGFEMGASSGEVLTIQ